MFSCCGRQVGVPEPAYQAKMVRHIQQLSQTLQFQIVLFQLAALPVLIQASQRWRTTLLSALAHQQLLALAEGDATVALAELLARELGKESCCVRCLNICGRSFIWEDFLTMESMQGRLTSAQALLLAPVLRLHAPSLQRIQGLRLLRQVEAGTVLTWSSFVEGLRRARHDAETPNDDAECILAVGVLEVVPPQPLFPWLPPLLDRLADSPWSPSFLRLEVVRDRYQERQRAASGVTLGMGTWMLCRPAHLALKAASKRCDLSVKDISVFQKAEARRRGDSSATGCCGCLPVLTMLAPFILLVLMLRFFENDFAIEMGYGGALMAQHPLKATTFAERLQYELLTEGDGS